MKIHLFYLVYKVIENLYKFFHLFKRRDRKYLQGTSRKRCYILWIVLIYEVYFTRLDMKRNIPYRKYFYKVECVLSEVKYNFLKFSRRVMGIFGHAKKSNLWWELEYLVPMMKFEDFCSLTYFWTKKKFVKTNENITRIIAILWSKRGKLKFDIILEDYS